MKKISKDLAPIALPHGPPVESVSEYYKSLMESARMVKKYPVWDVARPTPQVLMEQARRDLMEADEKLAHKREEERINRQTMNAKWQDLREKEMLLKDSFISFNKDYLMSVVHNYPEFKQPLDVLNRYEALAAAKNTLADRQERDLEMLESARQEIAALTEEKKLFIMGLNNTLADLRWRYDQVRNRVIKWELALNRLKDTAARRHAELCHVRAAVYSLYEKISRQKGLPLDAPKEDFEQQLVVIMRALLELRRIHRIAQRRSKEKDAESMQTA
ncbi:coiled-coil domain-containing protein 42 homolog isoform X2 [Colias croceus]|uniref:coiled-coil domain-containing protein 42 homolog isoform X2 n=1 Tax=Colias crocea TaxID=72248 RepID=UPI001E27F205|nr:coiled-coil domain-containing protein 42 homolog isoform X2 [Colias croceus]